MQSRFLLEYPDSFISSDDEEITKHVIKHLEMSKKALVAEPSLDESDS